MPNKRSGRIAATKGTEQGRPFLFSNLIKIIRRLTQIAIGAFLMGRAHEWPATATLANLVNGEISRFILLSLVERLSSRVV